MQPSTDREFLIRFEAKLDHLTEAIEGLGDKLTSLEEKKIAALQKDIEELKAWKTQILGAYKLVMLFWVVITAGIVAAFKFFFKWQ